MTSSLLALAVDDIETRWPWKKALGKFPSVTPGKDIWFVHPKTHLPSVVVLKLQRPETVRFKYRGATNDRISVDFSAGGRFLRDIAVTAAGFNSTPSELNARFAEQSESGQLFLLGLARAESRGPEGYNRLEEVPDRLRRDLDVDALEKLEKYCQILLIGILPCPKDGHIGKRTTLGTGAVRPGKVCREVGTEPQLSIFAGNDWKPTFPSSSVERFFEDAKAFQGATVVGSKKDGLTWRPSLQRCPTPMGESGNVQFLKAAT